MEEALKPGCLRCRLIVEIVGAPEKHVMDSLRVVLKRLKDAEGVSLVDGKVHPAKKEGELFSTFAEIEAVFEGFSSLSNACFDYMPSSVEIIEPESISTNAADISNFLNDLLARLHEINLKFANTNARNIMLERNCSALLQNALLVVLKDSSKPLREIASAVGLSDKQIIPFLDDLVNKKLLSKKGERYSLQNERAKAKN